jgi:hypothetical protein
MQRIFDTRTGIPGGREKIQVVLETVQLCMGRNKKYNPLGNSSRS